MGRNTERFRKKRVFIVERLLSDTWSLRDSDVSLLILLLSIPTQSPTVSQLGRMLSCQMIVSNGWNLQLRDIRGAFLEADALNRKQGKLYSSLPPGGIPGVPDGAAILILGNIYGLNGARLVKES